MVLNIPVTFTFMIEGSGRPVRVAEAGYWLSVSGWGVFWDESPVQNRPAKCSGAEQRLFDASRANCLPCGVFFVFTLKAESLRAGYIKVNSSIQAKFWSWINFQHLRKDKCPKHSQLEMFGKMLALQHQPRQHAASDLPFPDLLGCCSTPMCTFGAVERTREMCHSVGQWQDSPRRVFGRAALL